MNRFARKQGWTLASFSGCNVLPYSAAENALSGRNDQAAAALVERADFRCGGLADAARCEQPKCIAARSTVIDFKGEPGFGVSDSGAADLVPPWPAQNSRNMGPWMEEHAEQFCSAWNRKGRAGRRPNPSPSEGQRPGRRKATGWFSRPNGPTGLLRRVVGPLARKTTFSWPSRSRALPFAGRPDARSGLTCASASTEQIWNKLPSVPRCTFARARVGLALRPPGPCCTPQVNELGY